MPYDMNVESQVQEFRNLAKSKGYGEEEINAFISGKKTVQPQRPSMKIDSSGELALPGQQPTTPIRTTTTPQEDLFIPDVPISTDPIVPQTTQEPVLPVVDQQSETPLIPEPSFTDQALNKEQAIKPEVDILGSIPESLETPKTPTTNDVGELPSIPAPAGQDAPVEEQQQIPAPKGSPSKVAFEKVIPEGHRFSPRDGGNNLGGQCAWFSQQISKMPDGKSWTIGNSIQDKRRQLAGHIKNGNGFVRGKGQPKAGNSIVFDTGTKWGHVATINEIMPDGKIKLSESNWNNDLRVSHDRIIDPNDPTIMGYLKTVPNTGRK